MSTTSDAVAVEVPDIGDFEDVPIIEILVSPGSEVAAEDPLVTLESDKATMDVPAPFPGTVGELMVKVGDKVSQGAKLLTLSRSGGDGGADSSADDGPRPSTGTKAADSAESATQAEAQADSAPSEAAPSEAAPSEGTPAAAAPAA
ncbi:MAG TPA: biotin/lipoyl-containing protein, partial [Solirubrobacteraceae bacterium]|nr:biotin/lipoyl-containing protein [Solirubrobacteraceae bacterium]